LSKRRIITAITTIAAAACAITVAAPPSQAETGVVFGAGGFTSYHDDGDKVQVYDTEQDTHGVAGRIEIKQADGSWKKFPKIYVGTGKGTLVIVTQDVVRESADVKMVNCLQDGRYGQPWNCAFKIISGT
jgi:hypothetical protein